MNPPRHPLSLSGDVAQTQCVALCRGARLRRRACKRPAVRIHRTGRFPHLLVLFVLQQPYSNLGATSASHIGPSYCKRPFATAVSRC